MLLLLLFSQHLRAFDPCVLHSCAISTPEQMVSLSTQNSWLPSQQYVCISKVLGQLAVLGSHTCSE